MDFEVIDGHCHVDSIRYIPPGFLEDVASNLRRKLATYGPAMSARKLGEVLCKQSSDHLADALVQQMDACGIRKTVLLAPDFSRNYEGALGVSALAQGHAEILARHPGRFWFFLGADPRHGPEGVSEFERCVRSYGASGLKLYPPCGYSPSDERLFPYYEICAARGMPVTLHMGATAQRLEFRFAVPHLLDAAARLFPKVRFILAHGGVVYVKESVTLATYRPNVYLDLGGFTGAMHPNGWAKHVQGLLKMGVNHKIIFGTDWPVFKMSGSIEKVMGEFMTVALSGIARPDVKMIMGENMLSILPN